MLKAQYPVHVPLQKANTREFRPVRSPYDGRELAQVGYFDESQIMRCLELVHEAFRNRRRRIPAHERAEILRKTAAKVDTNADGLAVLIASEGGKPLRDAKIEVARARNTLLLAAEEATRMHGDEISMTGSAAGAGRLAFTTREPIGPVVAISAFNHPLNLIAHQVGPAVATGCPVLIKPALETPLSCHMLVQFLHESGLPQDMAIVVTCDNELAERMAASPAIGAVSFIGSAKVGWHLRSQLSAGVRCVLEHGGTAPVIVDNTADVEAAVPLLIKGGFYHAGQVCVSVQKIFVHREKKQELISRLMTEISRLKTGDPLKSETDVGPLIRKRDAVRVHEWVQEALNKGADLIIGGNRIGETQYAPTVIDRAPLDSRVMTDEIFGPVVCLQEYEDLDRAIDMINNSPWGFQAAVFSKDIDRALYAARFLNAGSVMVNDHTAFRVDWMPFAGRAQSGLGVGGVPSTMREMTQEKLIVFKSPGL